MNSFAQFGNDLYTGRRSFDFVGRLRRWLTISAVLLAVVLVGVGVRGLNFGVEFTGGSDFRVSGVSQTDEYADRAQSVVQTKGDVPQASSSLVGTDTVRVQTERLDDRKARDIAAGLATEFKVPETQVSSSVIGPSWGQSVSQKALQALVIFLILVSLLLAVYFRTWKMAVAALVALAHDIVITVGVYALAGFEVTPASMIGFLTILGYSLYDTVVVFDKVRENTNDALRGGRQSFAEAANLAMNQTLVRSINTSVVALLPVAVILVVGFTVIGPGTLLDLSLALFVGIAVGTYSSIFIATPLLVWLRRREPRVAALDERVRRAREAQSRTSDSSSVQADAALVSAGSTGTATSPDATSASRATSSTPSARGATAASVPARSTESTESSAAVRPTGQPASHDDVPASGVDASTTGDRTPTGVTAPPLSRTGRVEDGTRETGDTSDTGDTGAGVGQAPRTVTGRAIHPSLLKDDSTKRGGKRR